MAGTFEISSINEKLKMNDIYPPARISDLMVTGSSSNDGTVQLNWTATGDNLDDGKGQYGSLHRELVVGVYVGPKRQRFAPILGHNI